MQEALGQRKILSLLFIFGQENLNSIYPHETAKSLKFMMNSVVYNLEQLKYLGHGQSN